MVMGWIWTGILGASILFAMLLGTGRELASSVMEGAGSGVKLLLTMAAPICLWSGVGKVMDRAGITKGLSVFLRPVLKRLFPSSAEDPNLAGCLSANICANFLGLGNAATPMGIQAAKALSKHGQAGIASVELCRLVVLNTASIQLIPTTVAALRAAQGCATPFDLLPAVWITSICSVAVGLLMAWLFSRVVP